MILTFKLLKPLRLNHLVFATVFLILLICSFKPNISQAEGLVQCGGPGQPRCEIVDIFKTLNNIYTFLVQTIATPLAIIAITIGGIFILVSAGNPNLAHQGKQILLWAIIGLALAWGSWVIINFILTTLGYQGAWYTL